MNESLIKRIINFIKGKTILKKTKTYDISAQYKLAENFLYDREYDLAKDIFLELANQGNIESQVMLADMYVNGYGVKKDFS